MTDANVTNILLDINKNIGSLNSQNKTIFERLESISKTQISNIKDAELKNEKYMKIANKVDKKIDSIDSDLNGHKKITFWMFGFYGVLFIVVFLVLFFRFPEKFIIKNFKRCSC